MRKQASVVALYNINKIRRKNRRENDNTVDFIISCKILLFPPVLSLQNGILLIC